MASTPTKMDNIMAFGRMAAELATLIIGELIRTGGNWNKVKNTPPSAMAGFKACEKRVMKGNMSRYLSELDKYKAKRP